MLLLDFTHRCSFALLYSNYLFRCLLPLQGNDYPENCLLFFIYWDPPHHPLLGKSRSLIIFELSSLSFSLYLNIIDKLYNLFYVPVSLPWESLFYCLTILKNKEVFMISISGMGNIQGANFLNILNEYLIFNCCRCKCIPCCTEMAIK